MADTILEVKNLTKYFKTKHGMLHAVDGINFKLARGKTLGLVGESGCGKSTTGRTILRLIEPTAGEIIFEGKDINKLSRSELRHARKDMQLIFQDPYSSLDPRKTVSQIISEPIIANKILKTSADIDARVAELMSTVGLAARLFNAYPHELDGGRRQRVGIARALALNPSFLVLDEPVSALDVSIQAQVLNLMQKLQKDMGLTYLFISHNLSVVKHISDRIAVMYLGRMVELSDCKALFANPMHPYTKALLSAVPIPRLDVRKERILLEGDVPSPVNPAPGCRFAGRCASCMEICRKEQPELREVEPGHFAACHLIEQ